MTFTNPGLSIFSPLSTSGFALALEHKDVQEMRAAWHFCGWEHTPTNAPAKIMDSGILICRDAHHNSCGPSRYAGCFNLSYIDRLSTSTALIFDACVPHQLDDLEIKKSPFGLSLTVKPGAPVNFSVDPEWQHQGSRVKRSYPCEYMH